MKKQKYNQDFWTRLEGKKAIPLPQAPQTVEEAERWLSLYDPKNPKDAAGRQRALKRLKELRAREMNASYSRR